MTVSSYLEAFLTVYGWEMYYVFYLLFASIGLFLYPFLRILNDVYVSHISGSEYAATNHMRQLIASIAMAAIVFFVALVPMVSISLDSTTVKSVCAEKTDAVDRRGSYFNNTSTRVPIMPYLAMAIGHGMSSVVYGNSTCSLDITDAHKATMSADLSGAENPQVLKAEFDGFMRECHNKAKAKLNDILSGKYGVAASERFKAGVETAVNVLSKNKIDRSADERYLLTNPDSPIFRTFFYSDMSPLQLLEATKGIAPLKADNVVENVVGAGDGSQQQGTQTPPICGEWWDGSNGLRGRLINAMSKSVAAKMGSELGHPSCQNDYPFYMTDRRKEFCANAVRNAAFKGSQEDFVQAMFKGLQGGETDSVISNSDSNKLGTLTAGVALSFVPGLNKYFGDVGQQVIGQVSGFYISVFILKIMLQYFVPMILMAIYMFWAIYMTVGEFRGMTMIKGMILISSLTMMPALWSIVDHLDDALYQAMYYDSSGGIFNKILLDITTGIFEISIVFILFYLVAEAGGGNTSRVVGADQNLGMQGSKGIGSSSGPGLSGAGVNVGKKVSGFVKKWGGKTWNKLKP